MTNAEDIIIIKKHLPYEIDMLRQTYRKLGEGQSPDEVVGNALIESFCTNARSLLDFFESRPNKRPDDYVATDFISDFVSRINISTALRTKLNKEIFHLTGERKNIETDQFNMKTDGEQLIRELELEIQRFEGCLPPDFKAIFRCTNPPVTSTEIYAFKGPVNSTSVVAHMAIVDLAQPGQSSSPPAIASMTTPGRSPK